MGQEELEDSDAIAKTVDEKRRDSYAGAVPSVPGWI